MGNIGKIIAAPGLLTARYAEAMLKDVTPANFARLAAPGGKPVQSNHACWVFGHLATYHAAMMDLLGKPQGVAANPAGFEDLFKNKTECRDDPAGTIYPSMEKVTGHFFAGQKAVIAAAQEAQDELLLAANPMEGRMREMFPQKGMMLAFLLAGHPMSHLGQVSAWRRMMGLPSAM